MSRNLLAQGDYAGATAVLQAALRCYRQVGYRLAEGFVLRTLGFNAQAVGDYAAVLAHFEATLVIYQAAESIPRQVSLWKIWRASTSRWEIWGAPCTTMP